MPREIIIAEEVITPVNTEIRRERVGTEVFEVEYEEKKRTKIENESLVIEMISNSLTNLTSLNEEPVSQERIAEWASVLTQELKAAGKLA